MVVNELKKAIKKSGSKWHILTITLIILIVVARQAIFFRMLDDIKSSEGTLKIAASQNTISESILKNTLLIYFADQTESSTKEEVVAELKSLTDSFSRDRAELLSHKKSKKMSVLFNSVSENFSVILTSAKEIALLSQEKTIDKKAVLDHVLLIEKNNELFIAGMNTITEQYMKETASKTELLSIIYSVLLLVMLIALLLQLVLVFLPGQKKMAEAYQNIVNIGYRDKLTQMYNRYFFDGIIEEEIKQSDRKKEALSIILFDLDHFKKVNDTWGHPTGDDVLQTYAALAAERLRESNIFARYGGEEFIILLPDTTLSGALTVAEEIKQVFESFRHPVAGKVTASFGVAERMEAESFSRWYKRVDIALYRAKEEGRNRVVSFDNNPKCSIQLCWNKSMECGHPEIDRQHKELFDLGNHLLYVTVSENKPEILMSLLELMFDRLTTHFRYEEREIELAGYPEFKEHGKKHEELLTKAGQLKTDFVEGKVKAAVFISYLIDDVIVGHMIEEDNKFFPYIK